ncbi:MAG: TPMT family class I SAM-dependent methyltransferase [Crocinitomicaceae bacterium]|nr:TPMT family class I SAM-dependent methyltransferase [Crocinitomicaceae bacterium]
MEEQKYSNELDANFWNLRWETGRIGWDIGYASPPITEYMQQYADKSASILIPGCGNAYEAEFLVQNGFTNITLIDIAEEAVRRLKDKFKTTPQVTVLCGDFFEHQGSYDLIIEQTFFCAQVLQRRTEYVQKVHSLLKPNGKLVGVLFGVDFGPQGPPFGGDIHEYQQLFKPYFELKKLEPCFNSIKPREGAELFIEFIKK